MTVPRGGRAEPPPSSPADPSRPPAGLAGPPFSCVEVAVNAAGGRESTFVYSHASELGVTPGSLVLVPFGNLEAQAVVLGPAAPPPEVPLRPILGLLDPAPVLSAAQLMLSRWIADHYCCALFDALALMLPPGVAQRPQTILSLVADAEAPAEVTEAEFACLSALREKRRLELGQLRRRLAAQRLARQADQAVRRLTQLGVIRRETVLRPARIRPYLERYVRLAGTVADAEAGLAALNRAPRQREVLARLLQAGGAASLPLATLREEGLAPASALAALARRGLTVLEHREVRRDPLAHRDYGRSPLPELTPAQAAAWAALESAIDVPGYHPFLLYGVTGSGKTEVYLRLIAGLQARGKRAIVLVPEISLTPQTIQRFAARFPGRVAVLHSRLTDGERFDEWRRIREGRADVVIGSRSAVFAPVPQLGGIIVDEEHESSYKQDKTPRYHARDVALKLAEVAGLTVVLGSATPSLDTYYQSERGPLLRLELPGRVESSLTPPTEASAVLAPRARGLPPVEVVDLRAELRGGNRSIFSGALRSAVELALSLREQVILFLNRRGDSTFVLCRDCGYVMRCARCEAPLVYHSDVEDLVCHLCDGRQPAPRGCPNCWGERIRYFGLGTQKLESETRRAFPQARVLRWDRDAASARGAHEELLRTFVNHEADILVGTQMIAKGLDLPRVTLVGVISADTALHLPDFRAVERTFQLLTQVAGRAGRGPLGGKVIVQAYTPEHYCIEAARQHDYRAFYERELPFRREHGYPPFGQLARLLHSGYGQSRVQRETEALAAQIRQRLRREGRDGIDLIGPAPAFHHKIRGRYRWQIILRGHDLSPFIAGLEIPPGWIVDVDPVSTL